MALVFGVGAVSGWLRAQTPGLDLVGVPDDELPRGDAEVLLKEAGEMRQLLETNRWSSLLAEIAVQEQCGDASDPTLVQMVPGRASVAPLRPALQLTRGGVQQGREFNRIVARLFGQQIPSVGG